MRNNWLASIWLFCSLFTILYGYPDFGYWDQPIIESIAFFTKTVDFSVPNEVKFKVVCQSNSPEILTDFAIITSKCANEFNSLLKSDALSFMRKNFPDTNRGEYSINKFPKVHKLCGNNKNSNEIQVPIANNSGFRGAFLLDIRFACSDEKLCFQGRERIIVEMLTPDGYMSPIDAPLYRFYCFMSFVCVVLLVVWVGISVYHRNELLRIQYCIGFVVFLFFLDIATNALMVKYSQTMFGLVVFSAAVTSAKASVSRLLILFVSLGYGTTKARLGTIMCQVALLASVYWGCSLVFHICHLTKARMSPSSKTEIFFLLAMNTLDMLILWWSMIYLNDTLRQISERKNAGKLQIYRIFTYSVGLLALISLVFMIVETVLLRRTTCYEHWELMWVDETFWHMLGFLLLCLIVHLWLPGRVQYAYSVFLDPKQHDLDLEMDQSLLNESWIFRKENEESEPDETTNIRNKN